jgi:hypothetical protein
MQVYLYYLWVAQALSKYYLRRVVSYHQATPIIELPWFTSMHLVLFSSHRQA